MAELKPCNGKCIEEGKFPQPCFLKSVGLCNYAREQAIDAWNKRSK